jgi:hypothetical protein
LKPPEENGRVSTRCFVLFVQLISEEVMNFNLSGGSEFLILVMAIVSFAITVFWMIVGWRAMRAHERLASSVDRISNRMGH